MILLSNCQKLLKKSLVESRDVSGTSPVEQWWVHTAEVWCGGIRDSQTDRLADGQPYPHTEMRGCMWK